MKSLGRDGGVVRADLDELAAMSGMGFADLAPVRRQEVAAAFHSGGGEGLAVLHRLVLLCCYRDDRVMRPLDMELRPPFPGGFTVEQGDRSLLDPVRGRAKLWRDA